MGRIKPHTLTTNSEDMGKFFISSCLFPHLSNGSKDILLTGYEDDHMR